MAKVRPVPDFWSDVSTGYLRFLTRRGRRPNTMRAYSFELLDFGEWLHRKHIASLSQITRQHIEDWQDDLQERKAPHTQQLAATVVRGALRWAADQDLPLSTPALWLRVARPRAPRLLPRPIPQADLERILLHLAAHPGHDLLQLRRRALFLLILSGGSRISEALSLDRDQLLGRMATLIQKGGHSHLLVISKAAEAALADYLAARTDSGQALFVGHAPGPELGRRLCRSSEQMAWDRLCHELQIARFTTHRIRHTTATELLRRHVDSLTIARHLGHRGLGSIAGYAEVALESRREAMQALDAGSTMGS